MNCRIRSTSRGSLADQYTREEPLTGSYLHALLQAEAGCQATRAEMSARSHPDTIFSIEAGCQATPGEKAAYFQSHPGVEG